MPHLPEDDILTVIHEVAHLMRTRFDQRARAHGMTRAQWVILVKLRRGPAPTQNELAAMVEVEPITVARLIDRLEARGFVERRHDPEDRRAWRLHLLPAAEPILEEIAVARAEMLAQLLGSDVDAREAASTETTLRKMKSNLQSADGRSCAAVS
ncbi:MarR family winged helix-turn-helix transcriptional regulator [Ancylobacter pratisalsi]|uniref:MarR family transcriptional regulator n=1 Tax=Ancylobacter pratisalsi TaxID=1745854 RepID=A0A6P1YR70_9HYPH|nr:MarR family transcriptional regulator [Ancylobacter pratisalsi]QIB35390.1 MarR family transcriptional regulator [Ancylobacter pratisalsi]